MKLTNLTFVVTDACNFNCDYCVQKKENKTITHTCIKTAVDFFYPFLNKDEQVYIGFYGGEPLLEYDKITTAVQRVREQNETGNKNITFSVTTNGVLLTDQMLEFFSRHQFALTLSFDGLAQDTGRKKGTMEKMLRVMDRVRGFPGIDFEINSVFTPRTISMFSDSLRFMIERGGNGITFNINNMEEWSPSGLETLKKELDRLTAFLVSYYKETGKIPVTNFRVPASGGGVFRCGAGSERMAVTPDGNVWGCYLFHDYFRACGDERHFQYPDYSFGELTEFIKDHEERYVGVIGNYEGLRQDFFQVEGKHCFLCRDVKSCMVCPVNAAYSSGELGKISCRQCQLNKIQLNARGAFLKNRPPGPPEKLLSK